MAAKKQNFTIYPDLTSYAIVGGNSPGANRAVLCWAQVLRDSMPELERAEWNYIAALNGKLPRNGDGLLIYDGTELGRQAAETHLFTKLGDQFFGNGNAGVADLAAKCRELTWGQTQYILSAMAFYAFYSGIDQDADEWWTLPFRVQKLART